MSSNVLDSVMVPENMVRDFLFTDTFDVPMIWDINNTFNSLGLDVFVRNRGAAAVTIAFNGQSPVTIDPGDVYTINGTKIWLIDVDGSDTYDIQIFGIRIATLRRRGLMPKGFG